MSKFFAEDNPFNAVLTKVFDLCMLNIVALVCCIPVVTAGASLTAMYAVMLPMSENKEGPVVKSFFKQFVANLKGSVKTWLLMLLVAVVLVFDLYVWTKAESQYRSVFFGLTVAMLVALAIVASWYFALRATFEDNGKTSLINAGKYALVYLPVSVLMGAYTAGIVYVYLQQGYLALFIPIFGIVLIEYPKAWYMRRKFNLYIEEHSDIYGVMEEETGDEVNSEAVKEEGMGEAASEESVEGIETEDTGTEELAAGRETETEDTGTEELAAGRETETEDTGTEETAAGRETETEDARTEETVARDETETDNRTQEIEVEKEAQEQKTGGKEEKLPDAGAEEGIKTEKAADIEQMPEQNKNLTKGNSNKKKNRKKNRKKR